LGAEWSGLTPSAVAAQLSALDHFVVENLRSARRALRAMGFTKSFDETHMEELPRETEAVDWLHFVAPARAGHDFGLMSEAGAPGIADPGSAIVRLAHELHIQVVPLAGVSAITMALMASGLNGQSFAFNGYLPIQEKERRQAIRELERKAASGQTQIFIEAPYRNNQMMRALLSHCQHDTLVCVACDLTQPGEFISTRTVGQWKRQLPELNKRPTVFLVAR
jgi:16S rRNA (cytidine1402-2'-O)-methyltransferase